jgi:hypothetical protein
MGLTVKLWLLKRVPHHLLLCPWGLPSVIANTLLAQMTKVEYHLKCHDFSVVSLEKKWLEKE